MRIILVFTIVFLASCHGQIKEKKYSVIPADSFVDVLVDYHLSIGVNYTDYYREKMKDQNKITISDSILKEHGYNRVVFDSSVSFYSSNPELFDQMYEKAITRLSKMQADVQKQILDKKKKTPANKKK